MEIHKEGLTRAIGIFFTEDQRRTHKNELKKLVRIGSKKILKEFGEEELENWEYAIYATEWKKMMTGEEVDFKLESIPLF